MPDKTRNTFPRAIERDLVRIYRRAIAKFERQYKKRLMKAWDGYVKQRFDIDADPFEVIEKAIEKIALKFGLNIQSVRRVFRNLNQWSYNVQTAKVGALSSLGEIPEVDLIRTDPRLVAMINSYSVQNANLISDIVMENGQAVTKAMRDSVRQITADLTKGAVSKGDSIRTLSKNIRDATGVVKRKADFWARDQIGKAYGDMNKYRHTEAGFTGFVWVANLDNRLRDSHASRHGIYFEYNETDLIPGEDYNCRCDANPALDPSEGYTKSRIDKDLKEVQDERAWAKGETAKRRAEQKKKMIETRKKQKLKIINGKQKAPRKTPVMKDPVMKKVKKLRGRAKQGKIITLKEKEIVKLPKERAVAVDRDGNLLLEKGGTVNQVSFTGMEVMRMRGKGTVVTHNHPGKISVSFSKEDFLFMQSADLDEIRAVTNKHIYTAKRPKDGYYWKPRTFKTNYTRKRNEILAKYSKQYNEGKITIEQLNTDGIHELNDFISKKFGIIYKMEARK
jgi:SPP1 gp7 family putative phage head morphogenesis protein